MKFLLLPVFFLVIRPAFSQLSVNQYTYWKSTGNVYMVLSDVDLNNNGALETDNGTFKFTGKADNKIKGSEKIILYDVILEKQSPKKITLDRDVVITHGILFSSGLMNIGNFDIDLASSGQLKGETEYSRITSDGDGQIITSVLLNAPAGADPANLGASISSTQNLGLTTIRRGHAMQNLGNGKQSILRYYDISPANNSSLNATLRLNYFDSELNNQIEAGLSLWKSEDNVNWIAQSYNSRNAAGNYVEKQNINSFSSWTLSSDLTSLPVRDLALWGAWKNDKAALSWTTQSEFNNNRFEIERKYSDETGFIKIGTEHSAHAGGTSSNTAAYNYIDAAANNRGIISYRLKQVDNDGQFTYSKIIQLKPVQQQQQFIQNFYPTRLTGQSIYIQTGNMNLQYMQVTLFDSEGRVLMKQKTGYNAQWITLPVLSAAVYLLRIEGGEWQYNGRFVKG